MRERRRLAELMQVQRLMVLEHEMGEAALTQGLRLERDRRRDEQDADRHLQQGFDDWTAQIGASGFDPDRLAALAAATRARQDGLTLATQRRADAERETDEKRRAFGASERKLKLLDKALRKSRRRLGRHAEEAAASEIADRVAHAWVMK